MQLVICSSCSLIFQNVTVATVISAVTGLVVQVSYVVACMNSYTLVVWIQNIDRH